MDIYLKKSNFLYSDGSAVCRYCNTRMKHIIDVVFLCECERCASTHSDSSEEIKEKCHLYTK